MPQPLHCPHCNVRCNRPSHLKRHIASHLPPVERRAVSCPECGKHFGRNDVLLRHRRATHQVTIEAARNSTKSCVRCVDKKLKCDRSIPCSRCAKSRTPCSYGGSCLNIHALASNEAGKSDGNGQFDADVLPETETVAADLPLHQDLWLLMGESSPDTYTDDVFLCQNAEPFDGNHQQGPFPWPTFGSVVQDWLDFDFPGSTGDLEHHHAFPAAPSHLMHAPSHQSSLGAIAIPQLPLSKPTSTESAVQQWPFAHVRESGPSKYQLPPLRQILGTNAQKKGRETSTIDRLVELLYRERLPDLSETPVDATTLPAINLLRNAIDAYFSKFHDILPVIHVPTWDLTKAPSVLLAAMACIGAMHLDIPDAGDKANALSDACSHMIVWLGASNNAVYDDVHYLSACCLHQIYSLGSGNRLLYQNADRGRGMLVGSLRGLGALRSRLSIEQENTKARDMDSGTSMSQYPVEMQWLRWRDAEREVRLAWCSFEYDCSLCTLTNRRGAVDLSELPSSLPFAEPLWQASSAQAWKALQSQPLYSEGAGLTNLLQNLLSGEVLPAHISSWGKRLCSQVIGRLLWDLKQMEAIWVSDYLGVTELSSAQKQMKKTLLVAFGSLATTMRLASTVSELIDYNIARLIYHYSHLYSAEDILDLVVFILRGIATARTDDPIANRSNHSQIGLAKQRLISKLRSQPRRTRKLVWHAAQITAIADCYPVSAPCEILRVFMGYSFLLAFSRYCVDFHASCDGTKSEQARLDLLSPTERDKEMIASWVEHGGPAGLTSIDNICSTQCVNVLSQQAQALMHKLHGWGLADKFAKILSIFELSDG